MKGKNSGKNTKKLGDLSDVSAPENEKNDGSQKGNGGCGKTGCGKNTGGDRTGKGGCGKTGNGKNTGCGRAGNGKNTGCGRTDGGLTKSPGKGGANGDDTRALAAAIRADFAARQARRKRHERKWRENLAFLAGNQYDGGGARFPWEFREVYNHIAPIIETRAARLNTLRPVFGAVFAGLDALPQNDERTNDKRVSEDNNANYDNYADGDNRENDDNCENSDTRADDDNANYDNRADDDNSNYDNRENNEDSAIGGNDVNDGIGSGNEISNDNSVTYDNRTDGDNRENNEDSAIGDNRVSGNGGAAEYARRTERAKRFLETVADQTERAKRLLETVADQTERAKRLLETVAEASGLTKAIGSALMWSETCGTAFYKTLWHGGESRPSVAVVSPFEIYPDSDSAFDVDSCSSIMHARPVACAEIFERYGVRVPREDVAAYEYNPSAGGSAYNSSLGSAYSSSGGSAYSSSGGSAYNSSLGSAYNSSLGSAYSSSMGSAYSSSGGSAYNSSLGSAYSSSGGSAFEEAGGSALVIEKYERPRAGLPLGRLTVTAGDRVVYIGTLPYANGKKGTRQYPFVRQVSAEMPGSFWGVSVIERLIPVQKAFNTVKNRKHEFMNRLAMGVLAVEDGAVDVDELAAEGLAPGSILVYRQGARKPEYLENAGVPKDFREEEESLIKQFAELSGVSEMMRSSSAPYSVTSGTALNLLIEQDDLRLTVSAKEMHAAVKSALLHLAALASRYAPKESGFGRLADVELLLPGNGQGLIK